jgi:demethylmenaquinone methyltransferase/2-methoxy-6-polyprenyl-1,4-benzoquinol methylase
MLDKRPDRIAAMFDAVAPRYDLLNHLLSAGLDRRWRARAVRELALRPGARLLDLCTGTADLAIAAARRAGASVVGVDLAPAMLALGRRKVARLDLEGRIALVRADAMRLPLQDGSVDAAAVGFGIRNVVDPAHAARELRRVLRPGGRLAILEFGLPRPPLLRAAYQIYFRRLLPRIGRLVSGHPDAYRYLPDSVLAFPEPNRFAAMLEGCGFARVRAVPLTFGIVQLFVAETPA